MDAVTQLPKITMFAGVQAPSRADLLAALPTLPEQIRRTSLWPIPDHVFNGPMTITLPCGKKAVYATATDLPARSHECFCGQLAYRHFFVRYDSEGEGA